MNMRKRLAILLSLMIAGSSLAGCGSNTSAAPGRIDDSAKIGDINSDSFKKIKDKDILKVIEEVRNSEIPENKIKQQQIKDIVSALNYKSDISMGGKDNVIQAGNTKTGLNSHGFNKSGLYLNAAENMTPEGKQYCLKLLSDFKGETEKRKSFLKAAIGTSTVENCDTDKNNYSIKNSSSKTGTLSEVTFYIEKTAKNDKVLGKYADSFCIPHYSFKLNIGGKADIVKPSANMLGVIVSKVTNGKYNYKQLDEMENNVEQSAQFENENSINQGTEGHYIISYTEELDKQDKNKILSATIDVAVLPEWKLE